ncbi:MAG: hypothetical protein CVV57_03600 [Tenericutes bacterium HGW-Tenericutes-2]|jgi:hypothetical protein|nr:MAG: hypothetical protein CVV57_03600 [Tenericutes bacterium HGW-Tenericutes-2]
MKIRPLLLVLAILANIVMITTFTYAWFANNQLYVIDTVGATKEQYFAKGSGTEVDPYVISKAEHLYSLSKLHEMGLMQQKYYYTMADPITGNPVTIDFNDASLPTQYQTLFKPIGDHIYPFLGHFDGNQSIIKNVNINGSLKQDIGFFGLIGDDAVVTNFFLDKPVIYSNPLSTDSRVGFHEHGVSFSDSYATGFIAGHVLTSATLERVYVIEPMINSGTNQYYNGSKYGLIGNTSDNASSEDGGLSNAYYFELTAAWLHFIITKGLELDANTPLYVETGLRLSTVLSINSNGQAVITGNTYNNNYYTISTLKVSYSSSFSNPVYLYDLLIELGYVTPSQGVNFNKKNIDVVGGTTVDNVANTMSFGVSYNAFRTPYYNQIFNARLLKNTIVLYVRATGESILGQMTATFAPNAELRFIPGFTADSTQITGYRYIENRSWNNKNALIAYPGGSGATVPIHIGSAFAAVIEDANGNMIVVNPNVVIPHYYVFVLGISNSQVSTVNSVSFRYVPASSDEFAALYDVDVINNVDEILNNPQYINSDLYFDYFLGLNQTMNVRLLKTFDASGEVYRLYISGHNAGSSSFYVNVTNMSTKRIEIYINNSLLVTNSNKSTSLRFSSSGITISTS